VSSTGNIFPVTGENVDRGGLTAWTNPGNIVSDNTTDATCNATGSDYLVARAFDFSAIPDGATIAGITVRVEASEHSAGTEALSGQLQDETAALVGSAKQQTISGTGKAVYTYGGTADVWGASLSAAIVKDPDFGVRLWFTTAHDVRVDFVTMAVEYTTAVELTPGVATETDTALAVSMQKHVAIGVATETDVALAPTLHKRIAVGMATETDTALAPLLAGPITIDPGIATETDVALAPTLRKVLTVGIAQETDTALAQVVVKILGIGIAVEVDSAFALVIAGGGGGPPDEVQRHSMSLALRRRTPRFT
jgi:hypothetical protein